jgi:hypothetical protein
MSTDKTKAWDHKGTASSLEKAWDHKAEAKRNTASSLSSSLKEKHAHPRDAFIQFEESTHIYTVHGDRSYMSVTTWNHHHFPKFDADKIIKQIIGSRKHKDDPEYKYYLMTASQISDMWNANRDSASSSGTNMHYDIECYYNQIAVHNDSVEYRYFQNFLKENPHLHPYRTEWTIYNEDLKIAGSVDMVYENPDGTLLIYDWKRCKEITKVNAFGGKALTPCIRHLEDTNFWHYALQLNTYKAIIEEKYGKKVTGLCLVCLHPNNDDYQLIEVPFLEQEMKDLFEYRKEMLSAAAAKKQVIVPSSKVTNSKVIVPSVVPSSKVIVPSKGLLLNLNNL